MKLKLRKCTNVYKKCPQEVSVTQGFSLGSTKNPPQEQWKDLGISVFKCAEGVYGCVKQVFVKTELVAEEKSFVADFCKPRELGEVGTRFNLNMYGQ